MGGLYPVRHTQAGKLDEDYDERLSGLGYRQASLPGRHFAERG